MREPLRGGQGLDLASDLQLGLDIVELLLKLLSRHHAHRVFPDEIIHGLDDET